MITIKLIGGLANQCFGYGLGRSLGQTQEVRYDISNFGPGTHRQYSLPGLGLNLPLGNAKGKIVQERSMRFDPEIFNIKEDATLIGYFQNQKYLEPAKHRIRAEVFVGMKLSEEAKINEKFIREAGENSCFVHVRRTDYLKEPHASFHGNLQMSYYVDAMAIQIEMNLNTQFFIFSDDPVWCYTHFPLGRVVGGVNEFDDLYLQSLCHNAVIANSSYSWWGAWLNGRPDRLVIGPKNWFKNISDDASDIMPENWLRI